MPTRKVGQPEREGRLGLLYLERDDSSDPFVVRGAVRGWASESWDHTCGDPIIYAFRRISRGQKAAAELQLVIVRKDRSMVLLAGKTRWDLRHGIEWKVAEYLVDGGQRLHEMPIADRLNKVCGLAVGFFSGPQVYTPAFQTDWVAGWKMHLAAFLSRSSNP